jgi:stage II sporulation protein D
VEGYYLSNLAWYDCTWNCTPDLCFITEEDAQQPSDVLQATEPPSRHIFLKDGENGEFGEIAMEQYLTGVLLAEMPTSFELEALKAQAVAARTYTMKAVTTGGKHGDGSLCGNSGCCQGYISEENFLSRGGSRESLEKVGRAVRETNAQVLEYEGELIEAVYFSSSGGKTESALAVWGAEYPYLQSVQSPGEDADDYTGRVMTMPVAQFQNELNLSPADDPEIWISDITYTDGGGVERIRIGGTEFTGTQVRSLLQLPSTAFSVWVDGENVVIQTNGFGHRVGLSQYGANSMAKDGYDYKGILSYFYPGTTICYLE